MSSKKAEARERVKAMREEQARRDKKRERMMRFGVAGAVVAAVAIIAVAVAFSRGGDDGPMAVPESTGQGSGQSVDGEASGVLIGDESAPVTIDYWMDFLCPHCGEFHNSNGQAIDQLVESGEANIVYHPVTYTGGVYSTRANNAFACAADEDMSNEFIDAAFGAMGTQWSTSALVDLGEQAGIGGDYESCVRDDTYEDWSSDVEASARDFQVEGTPTVFVNGESLPNSAWTPEGITNAVQTIADGGSIGESAPDGSGGGGGGAEESPAADPTQ